MKRLLSFLTILVCLIAGSGLCSAAANDIHLKFSSGVEARISKNDQGESSLSNVRHTLLDKKDITEQVLLPDTPKSLTNISLSVSPVSD
jgi:hypothetical protein